MLIQVFGIWLMVANITTLYPIEKDRCYINLINDHALIKGHSCDEVAAVINKKIKTNE